MQSQTGVATWARGLEKELMIDRHELTCGSALLKDGKPSSCSFWAPARLDGEPKKTSDRNFWPAREPNTLQLLQTQSFSKELHKYQTDKPCSLTFASRWRGRCFPLRFESQRGTASHGPSKAIDPNNSPGSPSGLIYRMLGNAPSNAFSNQEHLFLLESYNKPFTCCRDWQHLCKSRKILLFLTDI